MNQLERLCEEIPTLIEEEPGIGTRELQRRLSIAVTPERINKALRQLRDSGVVEGRKVNNTRKLLYYVVKSVDGKHTGGED